MQLDVITHLEASDHVEQTLERDPLGIEQQFAGLGLRGGAGREDPQIAEHLALVGEKGRVSAFARFQVDKLVGDLTVQELDRSRAGEGQLATLGTVHQATALGQDRVLLRRAPLCPLSPRFAG